MIDVINFIVNTHDAANRKFVEELAERVPSFCFYTQLDTPEIARHYDPESEYPYVSQFPALLVHVAAYTIPAQTLTRTGDDGMVVTQAYPAVEVPAHFELLEPCPSYELAIQAVAMYEDNLQRIAAGEVLNPNPMERLLHAI